jgi:hypothetical protein
MAISDIFKETNPEAGPLQFKSPANEIGGVENITSQLSLRRADLDNRGALARTRRFIYVYYGNLSILFEHQRQLVLLCDLCRCKIEFRLDRRLLGFGLDIIIILTRICGPPTKGFKEIIE